MNHIMMAVMIKYLGFTWLWFFPQVTLGMTGSLNKQRGKSFKEAQQGNRGVSMLRLYFLDKKRWSTIYIHRTVRNSNFLAHCRPHEFTKYGFVWINMSTSTCALDTWDVWTLMKIYISGNWEQPSNKRVTTRVMFCIIAVVFLFLLLILLSGCCQ